MRPPEGRRQSSRHLHDENQGQGAAHDLGIGVGAALPQGSDELGAVAEDDAGDERAPDAARPSHDRGQQQRDRRQRAELHGVEEVGDEGVDAAGQPRHHGREAEDDELVAQRTESEVADAGLELLGGGDLEAPGRALEVRGGHEGDQRQDRHQHVGVAALEEVEAEERRRAHVRRQLVPGQEELADDRPEGQRDDGELQSAEPQGEQAGEHPHQPGEDDADGHGGRDRQALRDAGRDRVGADTHKAGLHEGGLPGQTEDEVDRQRGQRVVEDVEPDRPVVVVPEREQRHPHEGQHPHRPGDPTENLGQVVERPGHGPPHRADDGFEVGRVTGAEGGEPVPVEGEEPDHQPGDPDVGHPGGRDVAGNDRLDDADADAADEGQRQGDQTAEQGGAHGVDHHEGEGPDVDHRQGGHEHAGQAGHGPGQRPVEPGHVDRPYAHQLGGGCVLARPPQAQAEPGPPQDHGQGGDQDQRDDEDGGPLPVDDHVEDVEPADRKQPLLVGDGPGLGAVELEHHARGQAEDGRRADELAGGAGVHQRSDDEPFRQEGHDGGDADGHQRGDEGGKDGRLGAVADPPSLGADEARVGVGADEGEAAVGERQHPGGPEHERHGDRDQAVDGADHDPGGGQVQQFPHDAALRRMFMLFILFTSGLRGSVVHPPAEAPPGGRHRDRRPGARPVDGR